MLEQVIQEQNALLAKNNALLEQLIAIQGGAAPAAAQPAPKPVNASKPSAETEKAIVSATKAAHREEIAIGQVQDKLIAVSEAKGKPKAKEVLAQFKALKLTDLQPDQFGPVIAACDAVLKAAA